MWSLNQNRQDRWSRHHPTTSQNRIRSQLYLLSNVFRCCPCRHVCNDLTTPKSSASCLSIKITILPSCLFLETSEVQIGFRRSSVGEWSVEEWLAFILADWRLMFAEWVVAPGLWWNPHRWPHHHCPSLTPPYPHPLLHLYPRLKSHLTHLTSLSLTCTSKSLP